MKIGWKGIPNRIWIVISLIINAIAWIVCGLSLNIIIYCFSFAVLFPIEFLYKIFYWIVTGKKYERKWDCPFRGANNWFDCVVDMDENDVDDWENCSKHDYYISIRLFMYIRLFFYKFKQNYTKKVRDLEKIESKEP